MTEHDREFSRLYRQASVETPAAALDAAILKAARDKLAKPSGKRSAERRDRHLLRQPRQPDRHGRHSVSTEAGPAIPE